MIMNENVLKGISACDNAIDIEQAKIYEIRSVRLKLIKSYQLLCKKCQVHYNLEEFTCLAIHHYSNGDWKESEFNHSHLKCPVCQTHNRIYNHPQKEDLDSFCINYTRNSIFKKVDDIDYDNHHPWV